MYLRLSLCNPGERRTNAVATAFAGLALTERTIRSLTVRRCDQHIPSVSYCAEILAVGVSPLNPSTAAFWDTISCAMD